MASVSINNRNSLPAKPRLKKIPPYWYPYRTNAKARWFDREILEVVSTEFRDRSVEYYRYALESGVTTINGKIATPGTLIRNGDILENIVHRHEPPVTSTPVQIIHHDKERQFIVINKPGSIPVHAAGRYFKNSLVEILKNDFGFENVHTVNRLDRLTSGLMIIALSPECARNLTSEFTAGTVRKEYIARVQGEFPENEVTCEQPLLTIDRQMGLNIVHPEGKHAKTIFKRLHYDPGTNSSVVHCRPFTGRSHQIRVHLQFLGYPIANDTVYSNERIWGKKLGKSGIDLVPSDERSAPVPPPEFQDSLAEGSHRVLTERKKKALKRTGNPAWRTKEESQEMTADHSGKPPDLLPRETGHDIGMGSPVPLSLEAVGTITRMRNQKDEDEDWSRWRDVIFRAKGSLKPKDLVLPTEPIWNRKGKPDSDAQAGPGSGEDKIVERSTLGSNGKTTLGADSSAHDLNEQATLADVDIVVEGVAKVTIPSEANNEANPDLETFAKVETEEMLYCPECYLPLHPDPNPEKLYIFLHAIRYTTSLGSFETEVPEWAAPGFEWKR